MKDIFLVPIQVANIRNINGIILKLKYRLFKRTCEILFFATFLNAMNRIFLYSSRLHGIDFAPPEMRSQLPLFGATAAASELHDRAILASDGNFNIQLMFTF